MDQNKILHALLDVFGNKLEVSYLFGSHAAGRATDGSDLDLAVLTNEPMTREEVWQIAQKLAIRLGTEVDLIDLMDCNTVLSMQIIEEGKLLFDLHHKAPRAAPPASPDSRGARPSPRGPGTCSP